MLKHSVFTPFYFDIKFFKREQTQCIDTELKYFRVIVQSKLKKFAYSHNLKSENMQIFLICFELLP